MAGQVSCTVCLAGQFSLGGVGAVECVACADPSWCASTGGNCTEGRTGTGCGDCDAGFVPLQGDCLRCPAQAWYMTLPLVGFLVFVVVVVVKFQGAVADAVKAKLQEIAAKAGRGREADERRASRISQGVGTGFAALQRAAALLNFSSFVQGATTVAAIPVGWPLPVLWTIKVLSLPAQFDIFEFSAPECIAGGMKVQSRWLLRVWVPAGFVIAATALGDCSRRCGGSDWRLQQIKGAALSAFLVSYTLVASAAASPFDCSKGYMRDRPAVACRTSAPAGVTGWDRWEPWARHGAVLLGLCVVAIAVIAHLLRCAHKSGELFADGNFIRTYGSLYLRYVGHCYYWEVVILLRKLLLTLATRFLPGTWAQLSVSAFIFGASLALQRRVKPFRSAALNCLEEELLVTCIAIVSIGFALRLGLYPTAATALFFCALAALVFRVHAPLRAIWKGDDAYEAHAADKVAAAVGAGTASTGGVAGDGTPDLEAAEMRNASEDTMLHAAMRASVAGSGGSGNFGGTNGGGGGGSSAADASSSANGVAGDSAADPEAAELRDAYDDMMLHASMRASLADNGGSDDDSSFSVDGSGSFGDAARAGAGRGASGGEASVLTFPCYPYSDPSGELPDERVHIFVKFRALAVAVRYGTTWPSAGERLLEWLAPEIKDITQQEDKDDPEHMDLVHIDTIRPNQRYSFEIDSAGKLISACEWLSSLATAAPKLTPRHVAGIANARVLV